ncbi:hypothetical protein HFO09_29295 [Rhizobium laguerreae]|uniref:hypothetical protein n=1 Tax=Rhizobium laguerreae TaxID=1076926 RepID=UPI001C922C85|nr:hypothetical protein [Rhizobium laguerreae]MBY3258464.1 hypothetical protein [Rhizobium laguerreae]MBY3286451.1 hypothetical protein [Rhizobium laguerreae]MBY3293114.1 hypothetical protein [Rhizobium laguerreae]
MGSVKEHWLETRPDHDLAFFCPKCGYRCEASVKAPDLLQYGEEDEGDYGVEIVECMRCDATWRIEITPGHESYGVAVAGHPETEVTFTAFDWSSYDEDWDELPEPEPQPHDIFQEALKDWWALLGKLGDKDSGAASVNRMLFVQLFSIFEAYLSDEIIGLAMRDSDVRKPIVKTLPALTKQAVSLSTVAENPDLVRDEVRKALQLVSFHNLALVNTICNNALGVPLLPKPKDARDLLVKAVNSRHDCVHRNGNDVDGKVLSDVTVDWLMSLSKHFESMARLLTSKVFDIDTDRRVRTMFSASAETSSWRNLALSAVWLKPSTTRQRREEVSMRTANATEGLRRTPPRRQDSHQGFPVASMVSSDQVRHF